MKVKHLTHFDLDGVGCGVLSKATFGDDVSIEYVDYPNINERVNLFLDHVLPNEYDHVFITDISVNEETAKRLDARVNDGLMNVILLDHHNTASWLNKYKWAYVNSIYQEEDSDYKTSGTSLLLDYLTTLVPDSITSFMIDFAEQVRRYDTWEWTTVYNDSGPKELNDLLSILDRKTFIEAMLVHNGAGSHFMNFTPEHRALVDQRVKETKLYIKMKMKQVKLIELDGHSVAVVFAENHASELGNELALIEGVDYGIVLNTNHMSASFRGIKDDIDLGVIAKNYGGGGHPCAAGATFEKLRQQDLIKLFFISMKE